MDAFVSSRNKTILIPSVCQQAVALRRALNELRARYGAHFPFMKVYPVTGADRLNHCTYSDLYYVAVTTAIASKELGPKDRYMVMDVQTQTPKAVFDKYAEQDLPFEPDETTLATLKELEIVISERVLR